MGSGKGKNPAIALLPLHQPPRPVQGFYLPQEHSSHRLWPSLVLRELSWWSCWSLMVIPSRITGLTGCVPTWTLTLELWSMRRVAWAAALHSKQGATITSSSQRTFRQNGSHCNGSMGLSLMKEPCSTMDLTKPILCLSVDLRPVHTRSSVLWKVWIPLVKW